MKHIFTSFALFLILTLPVLAQSSAAYHREIDKAESLIEANKFTEAIAALNRAIEINPQQALAYGNLGLIYFKQKKITDAIAMYKKACDLNVWDATNFHSLGMLYLAQGEIKSAQKPLETAYELNPEMQDLKDNLAHLYKALNQPEKLKNFLAEANTPRQPTAKQLFFKGMISQQFQNNPEKAAEYFQQALHLEPAFLEAKAALTNVYLTQKKFSEAAALLEEIKASQFLTAEDYLALARIYKRFGKVAESIEADKQLLQIIPDNLEANENIGEQFQKSKKLNEAIPYLQKAIQIAPRSTSAYSTLVLVFIELNRKPEAFDLLRKLTVIAPDDITFFQVLGYTLIGDGQYDEGISVLKRALAIQPENKDIQATLANAIRASSNAPDLIALQREAAQNPTSAKAHYDLADAYEYFHKKDEALIEHRQAYKLMPDNFNVMLGYAFALTDHKQLEEALRVYQDYYQEKPDSSDFHFYVAGIYQELKKYPEAIAHYTKVLEVKPDANFSSWQLVLCYEATNQGEKVRETLEQLLKYTPDNANALHELAILYFNKNRKVEAFQLIERLKKVNPGMAESLLQKIEGK